MFQPDPVIRGEIPVIQKVIEDETWFEGERRGCYVSADDPVVREHVCDVVMRIGSELRSSFMAKFAGVEKTPAPAAQELGGDRAA